MKSKKNYSYIGISLVILVFGIYFIPKIISSIKNDSLTSAYVNDEKLAKIGKVPGFSLINQNGDTITNEDYEGMVYVAEFFYTSCPTICPVMNHNMVQIQNEFFGNPNFGVASFSINPGTDTPEVLRDYAEEYGITDPDWNLLTGDRDEIYELANNGFNLYVGEAPNVEGGFQHSGYFALIDKNGYIRSRIDDFGNPIIYYNGLDREELRWLKQDIKKLL